MPRFWEMLRLRCEHGVEFVVIGGFAVQFHGYVRATKDIDIVPDPSRENMDRLWDALQTVNPEQLDIGDFRPEEMPFEFTRENLATSGGNRRLRTDLGILDVMQWVEGVESYDELRAGAVVDAPPEVGHTVSFAGFDDLLTMKREAGRDQDRIDITSLRMAHGLEE
ncbi:MAG TPA: hypothetical protein VGJ77_02275 [Gaiellaceae bacterium]